MNKLDKFTSSYIETALWSSLDDDDRPLDENYGAVDIEAQTLRTIVDDCAEFQRANAALLQQAGTDEQNGRDYWLTRNRHGASYWDRGYAPEIADALTIAAHLAGRRNLIVGDDGLLHLEGA